MAVRTEEFQEQLIALVEERPTVYDIMLQCYSNRTVKDKLWREIESELRLSGKEVRKKWDNLRTAYYRYKKPAPSGSSGALRTARQQWILNRMCFIEPHTKRKESRSNLTRKESCDAAPPSSPGSPEGASMMAGSLLEGTQTEESTEEPELDIPLTGSPVAEVLETSLTSEDPDLSQRQPMKKKRNRQDAAANEEMLLMRAIRNTTDKVASSEEQQNDYISVFCKRFEQRVRLVSSRKFRQFEFEIASILYRFTDSTEDE